MMPCLKIATAICFIFLYGALILLVLNYSYKDLLKRSYLMFCFGSGGIALTVFLLSLLRIPVGLFSELAIFFILSIIVIIRKYCNSLKGNNWALYDRWPIKLTDCHKGDKGYRKFIKLTLILIIFIQIFYVFSTCILEPETSWDGRARWGLKAKILYTENYLYIDYFKNPSYLDSHPYYPLLVPIEMRNVYLFLGNINDRLVKILFVTYFIMLIYAFYDFVRRHLSSLTSLFFTALLATIPVFLRGAGSANSCMADLPLTFYCFVGAILLLSNPNKLMIALATGAVLFFAAFTKQEGVCYCLIFIFSYVLVINFVSHKSDIRNLFKCLTVMAIIFLLLYLPWMIFRIIYIKLKYANAPAVITFGYLVSKIHRLSFIIPSIMKECLQLRNWHIVWLFFFISLWRLPKIKIHRSEITFLMLSILGLLMFDISVYVLSSWWGSTEDSICIGFINITITRLLMPVAPLALLVIVYVFKETFALNKLAEG